ncbi:unnamed protein product [marine sediment metagenome]|uniref:Uncharacterized protein n=1 Tax=marine sediment metagenome TaxID=412755 RepID=X1GEE2_9ZZZZ
MKENLELLKRMMSPDYDWEKHHDEDRRSFDDVFGECYHWHDYRKGNRANKAVDCGSVGFEDTPKTLYRLLWLFQPDHVDFSDMYKTGTLLDFTDPEEKFVCSFQLYKYEAAIYFACPREFLIDEQEGQAFRISCGVPGAVFVWVYPSHKDSVAAELYHLVAWQYSMRLNSKLDICHVPSFLRVM